MSNDETILSFVRSKKDKQYCDDCLSALLKIYPRQQVNQICRNLSDRGYITRERGLCSNCSKYKIVNSSGKSSDALVKSVATQDAFMTSSDQGQRLDYGAFEDRVSRFVESKFGKRFYKQDLQIGPSKFHRFDLVSEDKNIIIECKSYTWTESGNFPSAKSSTAIEALFYFSRIVDSRKILVFQDHINQRGESLVEIFVRRYDGVIDDVEVWAYSMGDSIENDKVVVVRTPKDNWYEKILRRGQV